MKKRNIVLGITGGISAYKCLSLIEMLNQKFNVDVVITKSAEKLIDINSIEKIINKKVYRELFGNNFDIENVLKSRKVDHIDLVDNADLIVIAPATANVIAKVANGIADDFLTTMLLAATSTVVFAPSMNTHMWTNPITQENIKKLESLGYIMLSPESGPLACGYDGVGRLPKIEYIYDNILRLSNKRSRLKGKRILITGGGTSEQIDDVRVITNKSTGKMASSLVDECYLNGADIIYAKSINSVEPRFNIKKREFINSDDLLSIIEDEILRVDIMIHCAAVSDFIPNLQKGKMDSSRKQVINLNPTIKIIERVKLLNPNVKLIGFKAVSSNLDDTLILEGRKILDKSNADAIIVNDVSRSDRGFSAEDNEVILVTDQESIKFELTSKRKISEQIINSILSKKII